jgi:predicted dehydrogenase
MDVVVAGCGYWGAKHVRVLSSLTGVNQVGVYDPAPRALEEIAEAFGNVRCFDDLDEALRWADAAVVATPALTHVEITSRAIGYGCHVLVEKPLATNSEDAALLVAAARDAGVTLMVGHTFEYNAAVMALRDTVRSGDLGRLHYIDSVRLNLGPIRRDVNVIGDLAPHDVSICNYVLGAKPDAITAWASAHTHESIEDTASIRLEYDTIDVVATIRVSWLDPCKIRRTTVVGDRMMAVYNDLDDNERLKLYDRGVLDSRHGADHEAPMSYRYGSIVAPYVHFREPLVVEDEHFVTSIRAGTPPRSSGEEGLAIVRILEAAQQSVRERETVVIDWSAAAEPRSAVPSAPTRG